MDPVSSFPAFGFLYGNHILRGHLSAYVEKFPASFDLPGLIDFLMRRLESFSNSTSGFFTFHSQQDETFQFPGNALLDPAYPLYHKREKNSFHGNKTIQLRDIVLYGDKSDTGGI
jgi:pantothenate kinase